MNVHDSERLAGPAGGRGLPARASDASPGRARVQHLRGPRERRQPAVRQPRPPAAGEERHPRHADRGGRLPGAEGARPRSPSGRPGSTSCSAPTTSAPCRSLLERAREREEAQAEFEETLATFPSVLPARRESAYAAWVVDLGRLQQHLHLLHRAQPARQGEGPPARGRPGRGRGPGRRRRHRGHAARAERELLRRASSATGRRSASCCALRRRSTGWSGSGSPARTRATSPTT